MPSLTALLPLLLLLFTSTASAASAVLGIDLGTSYIKAAIVKPGTPLDIVLTKDSKRKEAAAVAFKPTSGAPLELGSFPERLYGGDALALGGRFPGDVYSNLKTLLGLAPGEASVGALSGFKERSPAIKVQAMEEMGTTGLKSGAFSDEELPWTVEELLAMELKNIRGNAESMAGKGSRITDAVITIPAFYTADERRAVERAANLAGINVMSLVSDGLAVGIDYAVKRTFPNVNKGEKPEIHLIFDMGAASTTATVLRFQGKEVKDIGRFNKTIQEVAVLGTGWDRTLGGNALNGLLVEYMVDDFVKKASSSGVTATEVKEHGRTASKIWKEAERARQVLSANTDVRSSFEGLYKDIDFATKLSRTEFEQMAASFAVRIDGPIMQALDAAKLTVDDLDSVVLHGGAIRTPFVQKRLETLMGKSAEVRSNVNSDESAAFGAAFKAAGLSPSFRVKEIRDIDAAIYPAGTTQLTDGKSRQQKLFVPTSQTGAAKQVTFKNQEDFDFGLYQQLDGTERPTLSVQTVNLTASVAALNEKFGCAKDDISTKFSIRLSPIDGIPEVVSGSVSCDVEGSAKTGTFGDSVKGMFGFGSKKDDQAPLEDDSAISVEDLDATSTSSVSSASAPSASASAKDTKPKKRTEVINIRFTTTPKGLPHPSPEEIERMKERLTAFDRSDKSRIMREEALNVLEGFTYRTRDLLSDVGFEDASTEAVRTQLSSLLSTTSDWLYGEGATATTEIFKSKLADLKALVDPVQKRREEATARPEKVQMLQKALESTKSLIEMVKEQVAKATVESSSAAAAAAATSEAAASSSSTTASTTASADGLDDLEEAETSTSSTTAKPSPSAFSPYTEADVTSVSEVYDSISSWLETKAAEQKKLAAYEDPVLSVAEVDAKAEQLNKVMMNLLQKKMQTPPKKSTSSFKKPKATNKSKKGKKSASTETGSGAAESQTTAASSASSAANEEPKNNFFTVRGDDEMPSEEDILKMIRKAQGGDPKTVVEHEEL